MAFNQNLFMSSSRREMRDLRSKTRARTITGLLTGQHTVRKHMHVTELKAEQTHQVTFDPA